MTPLQAGLAMLPATLGQVLAALLVPAIARRIRPAVLIQAGLLVAVFGLIVMTLLDGPGAVYLLIAGTVIMGLGVMPMTILGTDLVISSAPPAKAGAASATSETAGELGMALGIAVIGSIGAAVYRRGTISAIPAELPPELASVAADTLGGALSVAAGLPAAAGAELLAAARAAFHAALQVNAVIGAAVIVATAVLIATFLRHLPASSDGAGEPDTAGIAAPRME